MHQLHLFHLVVRHGGFTRAAEAAGLTQSAVTRQIQSLESRLGLDLLQRTTRSIRLTPAGDFLHTESRQIFGGIGAVLRRLREEFGQVRREVRMGVARSVSLAYLPGFLHANRRRAPKVACRIASLSSDDILAQIQTDDLDLGVLSRRAQLPRNLTVTHRFKDSFCLIAPLVTGHPRVTSLKAREFQRWAASQRWLLLSDNANTGRQLRSWLAEREWLLESAMELDDFDVIINLVALGMGVSFVPIRALALYGRKKSLQRIALPVRFQRELVVVSRRQRRLPTHVASFIDNILF